MLEMSHFFLAGLRFGLSHLSIIHGTKMLLVVQQTMTCILNISMATYHLYQYNYRMDNIKSTLTIRGTNFSTASKLLPISATVYDYVVQHQKIHHEYPPNIKISPRRKIGRLDMHWGTLVNVKLVCKSKLCKHNNSILLNHFLHFKVLNIWPNKLTTTANDVSKLQILMNTQL